MDKRRLLTGWAEFGEGSGVAPGDGSTSGTKLDASQCRHIVAQNGLGELDGIGDDGGRLLSLGVETFSEVLSNNRYRMSTGLDGNM